ncbi:MAG: helix-turn-helix domain-containing protein [Tolypothrix carrinoi HA7290-LM1]|nr:helix-turn-helix domain-containing protein [Tolypothrix carrinoi HA7290-LM1]
MQSEGFEAKSESEWENELPATSTAEDTGESQKDLFKKANSVLSEQMQAMKPDYQKILFLYYGFSFNQKQLAEKLGINQSTISRYLAKSTIKLLETLARTSQPQEWVKQYVVRWLERNYQAPLHSDLIQAALISAIKKLAVDEREVLQLYYGQQMEEIKIASHLGISHAEITAKLSQAINQLQEKLMAEINIWIKEYVEKWLISYYKSVLKAVSKSSSQKLDLEDKILLVEGYIQKIIQRV